jgi:hypothetical protein
MASTYSDLKIELIGTGEQVGTWGTTTNTNLGTAIGEAITGSATVTFASADVTLTLTNTNASQTARNLRLVCTGTSGGARNLILGSGCQIEKFYLIQNDLADDLTVKNTAGTGAVVAAGTKAFVYNDGTNVIDAVTPSVSFDAGTRMIFAQTTAPTGWTKDTSNYNNHALRVVTGSASTGGSVDFTTSFASQTPTGNISVSTGNATVPVTVVGATQGGNISVSTGNATAPVSVGNTTLAVPTIPSHSHAYGGGGPGGGGAPNVGFILSSATSSTGGGGAHSHPGSGGNHFHPASASFAGSPHTHNASGGNHLHPASGNFSGSAINLAVKYLDVITATKA